MSGRKTTPNRGSYLFLNEEGRARGGGRGPGAVRRQLVPCEEEALFYIRKKVLQYLW